MMHRASDPGASWLQLCTRLVHADPSSVLVSSLYGKAIAAALLVLAYSLSTPLQANYVPAPFNSIKLLDEFTWTSRLCRPHTLADFWGGSATWCRILEFCIGIDRVGRRNFVTARVFTARFHGSKQFGTEIMNAIRICVCFCVLHITNMATERSDV